MGLYRIAAAGALAALVASHAVGAGDDAPPDYRADTLTGDWGGLRSAAHRGGLALEGTYKSDWLRNRGGGLADGGRPINHLELRATADLDKLWGWAGTTAFVSVLDNRGGKTNADQVGSLMGVSNIEVPVSTTRLFHAWLEKRLLDGRLAALVGLYPVDAEFSVLDSACLFVHPSFGASADFAMTRGPSIFNNSAFGTRLKWSVPERGLYVQGALLDGMPGDPDRPKGTHVKFGRGDGSFHILEAGWQPEREDEPKGAEEPGEHYAKVAVGFWGYTARVDDLTDRDAAGSPERRRSRGWYVLGEQSVWHGGGDRNLAVFGRFSATDGDSTPVKDALNLGLRLRAPLTARPDDQLGLAATRARTGAKWRRAQAAAGIEATGDETVIEVTYRIAVTPWLAVQPLVQRIRRPGADRAVPDTTVYGARFEVEF